MTYYAQLLLNGIIAGSVYALFAVGLTMVYGVFRFINFAHGELIAFGAYFVLFFIGAPFSLPLYAAVAPALTLTIIVGLTQDRFVYKPLRHRSHITLLIASIGLSFLLRNIIRLIWGSDLQTYGVALTRGVTFFGLSLTWIQIVMMATAVVFLGFLYVLLTRTMLGKSLRAVSDNMLLADIMGISMKKVGRTVWVLASIFAGTGGILMAVDTNLEPLMGLTNLIKAFAAVLLGGAGNVWGALIGGLFIGVAENLGVAFFSPGYKDFISFSIIIIMLLFKPRGIFGIAGGVR
ncbi:MAG: branched-chain amino acid ABC transporter permease [Deltaproteobacteria bacterium]|nr:branched-chain amino acid ABC transporter permease [Deltaproteobacteria bacterium]